MSIFSCLLLLMMANPNSTTVVLKDGSNVRFQGEPAIEKNMLAITAIDGHRVLLSQELVDLKATWHKAPKVVELLAPVKAQNFAALARERTQHNQQPADEPIAITNDSLAAYRRDKPEEASTNPFGDTFEAPNLDTTTEAQTVSNRPVIATIVHDGSQVDIKQHLEPGKLTIFDFYADWCGPCRIMDPKLKQLVRDYPAHVALKKIDIVKWGTPVTKQYNIRSIPYVLLMDEHGKKLTRGGHTIIQYIKKQAARQGW